MKKKFFINSILFVILFIISCQVEVPVKEMVEARLMINRAREVMAEKYSKRNLDKAVNALYKSHDFLKQEKTDDAKKSAESALRYAKRAVKKSLPLLAKDTLSSAKEIFKEADTLNAEKNAAEDFKKAQALINDAEKLNNEKKYWESYLKSKPAINYAASAREKSLQQIPVLKAKIENLQKEREILTKHELGEVAVNELNGAKKDLDIAEDLLGKKSLKKIDTPIVNAEKKIKEAKEKIENAVANEKKKALAKEKIEKIGKEIAELKAAGGMNFAPEEIKVAEESLAGANELLAKNKPNEAVLKITRAEANLTKAKEITLRARAKEKLDSVGMLYKSIKEKDMDNKYKEDLDEANIMIMESGKLYDSGAYDESVKKSGDAELILNSISITLAKVDEDKGKEIAADKEVSDKDTEKDIDIKEKKEKEEGIKEEEKIYVVKWKKKDTDCLWRIALKVYKNARLWPVIYKANRHQIKDPDLIFPGQKFVIPPLSAVKKKIN